MTQVLDAEKKIESLKKKARLDLTLNDIRIILGCFRAVAYQEEIDDEPYLDGDSIALKDRLEQLNAKLLKEQGNNRSSR